MSYVERHEFTEGCCLLRTPMCVYFCYRINVTTTRQEVTTTRIEFEFQCKAIIKPIYETMGAAQKRSKR